ncbi:hypothetical protein HZA42_01160 [Candidatus Peregrinibacteria bacterium]|nr:hypothetical protein [Candidatus Peregrinibacteria bacterium]
MPSEVSVKEYAGPERRQSPNGRAHFTVGEQAVEIVVCKYRRKRPADADLEKDAFTGGGDVKKAVQALFARFEGKRDPEKVAKLSEVFNRGVDIWAKAGLFTPERKEAGLVKPDFKRDYERRTIWTRRKPEKL